MEKKYSTYLPLWSSAIKTHHQLELINLFFTIKEAFNYLEHGLRTPNEGINQRYLKNWANVADKIGIEFSAVQWRLFPLWVSVVRDLELHFFSLDLFLQTKVKI